MKRLFASLPYAALLFLIIWLTVKYFDRIQEHPLAYLIVISVTLGPSGITTRYTSGREHQLPFAAIARADREWPRTKVTTTDRETIYYPRGCWLLADLIAELAIERGKTHVS